MIKFSPSPMKTTKQVVSVEENRPRGLAAWAMLAGREGERKKTILNNTCFFVAKLKEKMATRFTSRYFVLIERCAAVKSAPHHAIPL